MSSSPIFNIAKKDIPQLLAETARKWRTYAPLEGLGGDVYLEQITPDNASGRLEKLNLDYRDMVISHKEILFPQSEQLFSYKDQVVTADVQGGGALIFGMRACDVNAMLFTDGFFSRDRDDIYYAKKREGRFIITVGCIRPPRPEACFCTSAGTGPFMERGYDLQLIEQGDAFLVEVGSTEGTRFIAEYDAFFTASGDASQAALTRIKRDADAAVTLQVPFDRALELMADDSFVPQALYEEIADKCIYCGGCVYACPTCTCFNVYDNGDREEGERVRNWDACLFGGYTREASGHNPRKERWIRTARRYEHKLRYDPRVATVSGCVGCGRCLSACPVNLGMSQFIQRITEGEQS